MPKAITIDDLAVMIKHGFDETAKQAEVNKRFEEVDKHFEEVDKRFEQVDKRLDAHEKRFERLELNTNHISATMDVMQQDIAEIKKHFVYRYEFEDLMARVKYIESKLEIESGK